LQLVQDIIDVSIPRKRFRSTIEGETLSDSEKYLASINLLNSYIIRGEIKSIIYSITVEVTDLYTHQSSEISAGVYQDHSKNLSIPTYTVASEDGNIFTAVLKENGQTHLYVRLSPIESEIEGVSIIKLATINTK